MKKTVAIFLSIISLFLLPSFVLAQGKSNQAKNQNQDKVTGSQNRSENARQQMSIVAQEVEQLLETREDKMGIGQQVRLIAQQQGQAQIETEDQLDQLESRKGWVKKLIGPDKKAIKNLTRQIEQNQLRVRRLEQLQNQVPDQADQEQIQEAVQAITEQNTVLSDQIQVEEEMGSLFGWLSRFFSGRKDKPKDSVDGDDVGE